MAGIDASGDRIRSGHDNTQLCRFWMNVIPMWINGRHRLSDNEVFRPILAHASEKQVEVEASFVDKMWTVLWTHFSTVPTNPFNLLYILSYYREME